MGGMGFIENNKALCMLSVLISTHMLDGRAGRRRRALLLLVAPPASTRPTSRRRPNVIALAKEDAYPAMPEDGYGWEKLFSERMCRHFREDFGLHDPRRPLPQRLRPARHLRRRPREGAGRDLPQGRSTPSSAGDHEIEIWGDGEQTRSFTYIDDCLEGTDVLHGDPTRARQRRIRELVTINQLVDHRRGDRRGELERRYKLDAPQGVRGRNSDNTRFHAHVRWEPMALLGGMERTYHSVWAQLMAKG